MFYSMYKANLHIHKTATRQYYDVHLSPNIHLIRRKYNNSNSAIYNKQFRSAFFSCIIQRPVLFASVVPR